MVQRGRRAVYDPEALAFEKPTPEIETEYRRKVRMFEHCWLIVLRGQDAAPPAARLLRRDRLAPPPALRAAACSTSSLLGANVALVALRAGIVYDVAARPPARVPRWSPPRGRGLPRYYALVTWATVVSLWNYLRRGVPGDLGRGRGNAMTRRSRGRRARPCRR